MVVGAYSVLPCSLSAGNREQLSMGASSNCDSTAEKLAIDTIDAIEAIEAIEATTRKEEEDCWEIEACASSESSPAGSSDETDEVENTEPECGLKKTRNPDACLC